MKNKQRTCRLLTGTFIILVMISIISINKCDIPVLLEYVCHGKKEKMQPQVYSRMGEDWVLKRFLCNTEPHRTISYQRASLLTENGYLTIFTHDRNFDRGISAEIIERELFEPSVTYAIIEQLKTDSDLNLIDIGANLGVHTLPVASMGRHVMSIEPLGANIQRLCASVVHGKFQTNVTIIQNSISNHHAIARLGSDLGNVGGTYVDAEAEHIRDLKLGRARGHWREMTRTIILDDLLDLPVIRKFNKVVLKLDIEGYEHKALQKANSFFRDIEVKAVLLEWDFHRNFSSGFSIISTMTDLGYSPFRIDDVKQELKLEDNLWWPNNVIWLPY